MTDNKQTLRLVDYESLWKEHREGNEDRVEKVERVFQWPDHPEHGPYRTAQPCDGCNHASYAIHRANLALEELDRFKRRVVIHCLAWAIGVGAGATFILMSVAK